MSLAKIWSRFFDERKRRPREPAPSLRVMQEGLHALVRRNGTVHFARHGRSRHDYSGWPMFTGEVAELTFAVTYATELTFIVTYLSGTTESLTTKGSPQAAIFDLLPSVIREKYYVAQVALSLIHI